MRIVRKRKELKSARSRGDLHSAITQVRELLHLLEIEGLRPLMPEYHEILARLCLEMGNLDEAKWYSTIALDGWGELHGVDSPQAQGGRRLLKEIESREMEDNNI